MYKENYLTHRINIKNFNNEVIFDLWINQHIASPMAGISGKQIWPVHIFCGEYAESYPYKEFEVRVTKPGFKFRLCVCLPHFCRDILGLSAADFLQ